MRIFKLPAFLLPDNRKLESQLEIFRRALEAGGLKLENIPFLDGILKEDVTLINGDNTTIYHGLDRVPRGWVAMRALTSAPHVFEVTRSDTTLVLHSHATGSIDLWVY